MTPLPQWPVFNAASPNAFFVRAAQVYNNLTAAHFTMPAKVGLMVNADMESDFESWAVGDQDQSFSIWQWKWNPRGMAIAAGIGIDVRTERSIPKIVQALVWELTHVFPSLDIALMQAQTGEESTGLVCAKFEMAGAADALARRVLDAPRVEVFIADNIAWIESMGLG